MLQIDVPGFGLIQATHLVCDYNGTIAEDGRLLPGIAKRFRTLAQKLTIVVVTADTFGSVAAACADLPVSVTLLPPGNQDLAKKEVIATLGCDHVIAVGNGRNDAAMLATARLGIAVIQRECAAATTMMAADVVATDIDDALDLLLNPLRLTATLRT